MNAIDLIEEAARPSKAKKEYEERVQAVIAHTSGGTKTVPDPELTRLQREVDEAHKQWVKDRQSRSIVRQAEKGRDQKIKSLGSWQRRIENHLDHILSERKEEDWYADRYWGLIPVKLRQAEQRCKEYEEMLSKFLPMAKTQGVSDAFHLLECKLCGEIILGKGARQHHRGKTLSQHMKWAHWTSSDNQHP